MPLMPFNNAFISTEATKIASGTLRNANSAPADSKITKTAQSKSPPVNANTRFKRCISATLANARQAEIGHTNEATASITVGLPRTVRKAGGNETATVNNANAIATKSKGVANRSAAFSLNAAMHETARHISEKKIAPTGDKAPFETKKSDENRKNDDKRNKGISARQADALHPFTNGKRTTVCNKTNGVVPPSKESETKTAASGNNVQNAVIRRAPFCQAFFSASQV